jgi:hypothetical protein
MVKQKTVLDGNTRKTADVTLHNHSNLSPHEQWEVNLDATPAGNLNLPSDSFLPVAGKNRPTPHKKINECDH